MKQRRKAFTMIELIFVIVIIGILAKFGVEFLIQAYNGYIFSSVQNKLQTQTEVALEQIANRLQYRIKPSIIVRDNNNSNFATNFRSLANANNLGAETIIEWVGYDIDGVRGITTPTWSGFIDLKSSTATSLNSLETNTSAITSMIQALSGNVALSIADSALFFIGGNSDINKFGWAGTNITDQNSSIHPITSGAGSTFTTPTFSGQDAYEYYQLAWTAYALVWNGNSTAHNTQYIDKLDNNDSNLFSKVLPSPLKRGTSNGQWRELNPTTYIVKIDNTDITFTYSPTNGTFDCVRDASAAGKICKRLTN